MWNPIQKIFPKKFLGVDVGTSSIKAVELSRSGSQSKLENYGQISSSIFYEKALRSFERSNLFLSSEDISKAIKTIAKEAGIKTKRVIFSIPDFATFFTNFDLPPMTKEELPEAVKYEARQHIPVPLSEVVLDWQIIKTIPSENKKTSFKILLVAVPKDVINQYEEIAKASQLELLSLEAEVFSLMRALIKNDEKKPVALVDIGAKTTTCSIVDEKILKTSHSFDLSGNDFSFALAKELKIGFAEAEKIKKYYGIKKNEAETDPKGKAVREILLPLIETVEKEIKGIADDFYRQERKEIEKIIIIGSTVLLPGLKEHFQEFFEKNKVEIGNPFSDIFYPSVLEKTLQEIGPSFAIATGAALR